MYDLLELNALAFIEFPTQEQKERVNELRKKLFGGRIREDRRKEFTVMFEDGTTKYYDTQSSLELELGISRVTIENYVDTDKPVKQGRNKGLLIYSGGGDSE